MLYDAEPTWLLGDFKVPAAFRRGYTVASLWLTPWLLLYSGLMRF